MRYVHARQSEEGQASRERAAFASQGRYVAPVQVSPVHQDGDRQQVRDRGRSFQWESDADLVQLEVEGCCCRLLGSKLRLTQRHGNTGPELLNNTQFGFCHGHQVGRSDAAGTASTRSPPQRCFPL